MRDAEKQSVEAIAKLRGMLQPGDTVYTILNSVSRSGMKRRISLCVGSGKDVHNITWLVAHALGEPIKQRGQYVQDAGISVSGCGTDMGFNLVYNLSRVLFREGFECAGERCPSNDHSNGDPNYGPHMHTGDGGYALKHKWL